MDALEAWGDSKIERGPKTIGCYFERSGIYIFLISSHVCITFQTRRSCLATMIWDGT
jgi:hypothetical protein